MDFLWNFFERISDVVGPQGAVVVSAFLIGLAIYFVLGSSGPSRR